MYNLSNNAGFTGVLSKAGLAEGTNSATIAIAAPNGAGVDFAIDGIAYHKADADNIAMTALAVQAANTTCLYLVQINAAGTVSIKKGVAVANGSDDALVWPQPDAANCALGGFKVVNAGSSFTSGTTDLGSLETWYDFAAGGPPAGLVE
jgi:hypothetical protein